MNIDEKIKLITRNTDEVITIDELKKKLEENSKLKGYIGFEPSGLFHIGWLIWAQKLKDLIKAGVDMSILVATWHAMINDKLGGDLEKIKLAGKYALEVLEGFGVDMSKLKVVYAEDLVENIDYWSLVVKVAKNTSLARMKRALTIMGRRSEEAELDTSKLIYPAMQVSDIFFQDLDIALGGTDQRKAHMLARDVAEKLQRKKVIAIHTPLLVGLQGGQRMNTEGLEEDDYLATIKMSKSKPETAIFIHDSPELVESKLKNSYCPKGVVNDNPVLQINKYIIFGEQGVTLKIERDTKYGGDIEIKSYEELERIFIEGKLHPLDLKLATARKLNDILDPIRKRISSKSQFVDLISSIEKSITR
ncbi:tyrosine--tRNA ligase [Sulfolobus acidocaldarius]|uniref:Tyrosine--tRNA ligase n=4 Tax=Sulfolobus acidocaldarius TaxID=2285 RepID=SYY_SULAC|nr:tyrosine--tRNA ligase [Sulfolobus acidocaldarius]Q4JCH6.1 RecName: Full=Tyrosine--tRNA ligase; AltName: Full=Tyrosyl-tRNA synthetase; Short=TyrRS [Sulfolobus acidocaldarius DSM 639]AAY79503.1 tyrosyl-tRNA synthetase [Sulfolobus acidocaldarius DSM 639]AGE70052.1 tyrosyl-tRNA synthetase [Sulfolobus acidocaldarius N8]AGE72327.1 tyrosyl-tRNA synthetase [Sulfolobus acidocaldarius Ron12/I]ALU29522.1 tyrosine--tRNA ligase [Sulfolobus acidocaldarius]ALU32252.1 tyrosine--tRNA ligase [Sulfolobus aci